MSWSKPYKTNRLSTTKKHTFCHDSKPGNVCHVCSKVGIAASWHGNSNLKVWDGWDVQKHSKREEKTWYLYNRSSSSSSTKGHETNKIRQNVWIQKHWASIKSKQKKWCFVLFKKNVLMFFVWKKCFETLNSIIKWTPSPTISKR